MPLTPGARFGPYEITGTLGVGGMGEVYRARDSRLDRDVAIKVLPTALAGDADRLLRFEREARVLASLNHPQIAHIYGFEAIDAAPALVMELVEGPTLADRIARGALPVPEALVIAKQIAAALEAAHEQGVVHRDLKPANIKVRPDGTVKVLDFGLAKAMDPGASGTSTAVSLSPTITSPALMTGAGIILGTAAYMSPEQARGKAADKRADIWAFGVVVYEMLTGRRAFDATEVSDVLADILRVEPAWAQLPADVPPALVTFLKRCLRKDPQERIRDIGDMRLALDGAFDTLGAPTTIAPSEPAAGTVRRWLSRVAALIAVAALAAAAGWLLKPAEPQPVVRAVHPLPESRGFRAVGRRAVAISPDGRHLLYNATGGLYVRRLDELEDRVIPNTERATNPTFSPDGQSVAFFQDGQVRRVLLSGGAAVPVVTTPNPGGISWDRDGSIIYALADGVWEVSDNGGEPTLIIPNDVGERLINPQRLTGGDWVLATRGRNEDTGQAALVAVSSATGERRLLRDGAYGGKYVDSGHIVFARDGVLHAMAFDAREVRVTGRPVPVVEGVRAAVGVPAISHFAVSRSGTLVYIPGPVGGQRIGWSLAVAGSGEGARPLTALARPYEHVRTSPDGSLLAADTDDGKEAIIWIIDPTGANAMRRLTFGGRNRFPVWAPDGARIAFQSDREGDLGIFAQRADGSSDVARLTKAGAGEAHVPESWSPDGQHLTYSVVTKGVSTLWILPVGGSATRWRGIESTEPIGSVFSPNGRWVAYHVRPQGQPQTDPSAGVFVEPFPPSGARYQAPRVNFDFQPLWSRDGRRLFYVPTTASMQLASVTFVTDRGVTFGSPVLMPFDLTGGKVSGGTRAFDVYGDGQFVGLAAPADPAGSDVAAAELGLVFNWFGELQRVAPAD
jgi:eukaryotic-like serine/threonine-protein kinase